MYRHNLLERVVPLEAGLELNLINAAGLKKGQKFTAHVMLSIQKPYKIRVHKSTWPSTPLPLKMQLDSLTNRDQSPDVLLASSTDI